MSQISSSASAKLPIYSIRNWETIYENHGTRKVRQLTWVATPNKHDGRGFRRLMRMSNGLALYGAWHLILQVASKMPQRGVLADIDGPLTAQDIADKTGAPVDLVALSLEACSSPEIGWIDRDGSRKKQRGTASHPDVAAQSPGDAAQSTGIPGNSASTDRQTDRTLQDTTLHDMEGKDRQTSARPAISFDAVAPFSWESYWQVFLVGGKKLNDRDQEKALTIWISMEADEQRLAVLDAVETVKAEGNPKYIPFPVSHLRDKPWTRTGPGRLIPEPRKPSRAEIGQAKAAADFMAED